MLYRGYRHAQGDKAGVCGCEGAIPFLEYLLRTLFHNDSLPTRSSTMFHTESPSYICWIEQVLWSGTGATHHGIYEIMLYLLRCDPILLFLHAR